MLVFLLLSASALFNVKMHVRLFNEPQHEMSIIHHSAPKSACLPTCRFTYIHRYQFCYRQALNHPPWRFPLCASEEPQDLELLHMNWILTAVRIVWSATTSQLNTE